MILRTKYSSIEMLRDIGFREDTIIELDVNKMYETRKIMSLFDLVFAMQHQKTQSLRSTDLRKICDTIFFIF
jgi:hypothetical protein